MSFDLITANLRLGLVEFNATFFFQIFNTFVLYLFLRKLLFKPVTELIENREMEIASDIDSAIKKNEEAEELKNEYNQKIKDIENEGKKIIKEAKLIAETEASKIIEKVREDEKEIRVKNQMELEREKVKAINELKDEISNLTIMAASKVIGKNLKLEDHIALIDQFIDEVGDTKWQN
ncbi:F0F1 ATP synthase subunit B [Clostridiaceae bacterium HSG29]|nr:F0F1 ATP synthase subunit B [Clostridiaceae bacterium HSG29]